MPQFTDVSVRFGLVAVLGLVGAACSHPATGSGAGSGGNTAQSGGASGAGTGSNTGTGNVSGGSGGISGGSGGRDPIVTSTGGTGNPDAGAGGSGMVERTACQANSFTDIFTPGYVRDPAVMTQVATLLTQMSVADKANQMRGTDPAAAGFNDIFRTPDVTPVKGFLFRDGPRGVNLDAPVRTGTQRGRSTVFPVSMARGAAWDLQLEYEIGMALGDEMIAAGQTMLLVPTANILRHPLWGRAQETYGEDPFQLGRLSSALIVGLQKYVPGCAKHYAANNIEQGRASLNAMMDEQTLREIYARHFGMMIKDGGVACIMAAYNQVNGKKSTQNSHLLNDILRTDFGFKGFVLTDWWAMPGGSSTGLQTPERQTNTAEAVPAGLDMEVPWSLNFSVLESITGAGRPITQAAMDQAVSRILEQKIRFKVNSMTGAFGLLGKDPATTLTNGSVTNPAHVNLALKAALESMVLLKNENNTLPIKRAGTVRSIAVVGTRTSYTISNTADDHNSGVVDFPNTVRTGDVGSSRVNNDPALSVGPTAGIMMAAGAGITVTSSNGGAAIPTADFYVVVAGLTPQDEGEEYTGSGDRSSLSLDAKFATKNQDALIMQVAALGKPMVVVLEGGSVIAMPWLSMVPAVVMAWYPGMVGGKALGQLLFGDVNFSGKLPITWGASLAQYPTFNAGMTTTMDFDIGYRRFDRMATTPQFPIGHGLSYATFEYSNLQLSCSPLMVGAPVTTAGTTFQNLPNSFVNVTVDIKNTGTVPGEEIAFLFVSYPAGPRRPVKELKGFSRVQLDPGITRRVSIPVRVSDLAYFDMTSMNWKIQPGALRIMVGGSGATSALTQSDTLTVQ
jgi:beta-glucosidase